MVFHEAGTTFSDPGATCGTASVSVTGEVDTWTLGTYTLTYTCQDSSKNASRTVEVVDSTAPVISLLGEYSVGHEAGTDFVDPGAECDDSYEGDLSGDISTSGTVDTGTLGAYTLTYHCVDSSGNAAIQEVRAVTVVDSTAPVITLNGVDRVYLEAGTPFTDVPPECVDSFDVNPTLTTSGTVDFATIGDYELTYDCVDSSGNAAVSTSIYVTVVDTTAPKIVLNGEPEISILSGLSFTDPGASCEDNSLDVTLSTSGTVDTQTLGTYTLTYECVDSSGNEASKSRIVTVYSCDQLQTKYKDDCGCNGPRKDTCDDLELKYKKDCNCTITT